MPRKLRIQYPGAIYHVMSRGDQRENIFKDDKDRERFIHTLASVGSGNGYLRTVCDYVHLNPVRAGLIEPEATLDRCLVTNPKSRDSLGMAWDPLGRLSLSSPFRDFSVPAFQVS